MHEIKPVTLAKATKFASVADAEFAEIILTSTVRNQTGSIEEDGPWAFRTGIWENAKYANKQIVVEIHKFLADTEKYELVGFYRKEVPNNE